MHLTAVVLRSDDHLVRRLPHLRALGRPYELANPRSQVCKIRLVFHLRKGTTNRIQVDAIAVGIAGVYNQRQEITCHNTGVGNVRQHGRLICARLHCNLHVPDHFTHLDQRPVHVSPLLNAQGDVVDACNLRHLPNEVPVIHVDGKTVVTGTHLVRWHIIGYDLGIKPAAGDQIIGQEIPIGIVCARVVNPGLQEASVLLSRIQQLHRVVVPRERVNDEQTADGKRHVH